MALEHVALHVFPHPDDEALGAPVALQKLHEAGWKVTNVSVTRGRPEEAERREKELRESARRSGLELKLIEPGVPIASGDDHLAAEERLTNVLIDLFAELSPSIVMSPHENDVHYGHELVARAARRAVETIATRCAWWTWGLWAELREPNLYVPFDQKELDAAMHVLDAHVGEIERNNFRNLLLGHALAAPVIGSERIFGFKSPAASSLPYAELLTEMVWTGKEWTSGDKRVL